MAKLVGSWLVGCSMLMMLVVVTGWGPSLDDVKEHLQQAGESARQTSESWGQWASEKFSRGFGDGEDGNHKSAGQVAEEAASAIKAKASEAAKDVKEEASSAFETAKQKVGEAYETATGKEL